MKAKVLVHVGRGHNQKLKFDDWALMGWHFGQISRIEPFSINQMMSERSAPQYEHVQYRYVTKKRKFTEPVAFQSKSGEWWKSRGYDLVIFHPRSIYKNGRPTWLEADGRRRAAKIDLKKLKLSVRDKLFAGNEPILIQAFAHGESADAVPVDQIILYPEKPIPVLMLPAGNYRLKATDRSGKIVAESKMATK